VQLWNGWKLYNLWGMNVEMKCVMKFKWKMCGNEIYMIELGGNMLLVKGK